MRDGKDWPPVYLQACCWHPIVDSNTEQCCHCRSHRLVPGTDRYLVGFKHGPHATLLRTGLVSIGWQDLGTPDGPYPCSAGGAASETTWLYSF
jgi:hypothetical protein